MDAGGRAMQDQLPRGEIKNISFSTIFLSYLFKKENKQKIIYFNGSSPKPMQERA